VLFVPIVVSMEINRRH